MTRSTFLAVLAFAGCSQQQAPEFQPVAEQPAVVIAPQPVVNAGDPKPLPQPPAPVQPPAPTIPAPPLTFAFTPDLTGRALPRVVAPAIPVKLPGERFGGEPKPRAVPAKILDPDVNARVRYAPPPLLPTKTAAPAPAPPIEKVPLNLGAGAGAVPVKPVLPVAAVVTERARDVNLPPLGPILGRQLNDRVPFDDPTNEAGNAVVVAGAVKVPLGVSGFLKVTIPDPFELSEQVKPSVPPAAEPGAAPIPVNPQRVK